MRRSIQLGGGVLVHLMFAVTLSLVVVTPRHEPVEKRLTAPLVWAAPRVGVTGGGGGGGNLRRDSPAPVQNTAVVQPRYVLPHLPEVTSVVELPGTQVAFSAPGALGRGTDTGPANGLGEGREGPGSGVREGPGAGSGDRPFVDGAPGLTSPKLLREQKPEYTHEAMTARVQGTILVEAVVRVDGTVEGVRVVRTMNPSFGLDRKAVEAVHAWRFVPGTFQGRAVPVKVLVEVLFGLR